MAITERQQRLQRTMRIPNDLLGQLIARVNLIDPTKELPALNVSSRDLERSHRRQDLTRVRRELDTALAELEPELKAYIWRDGARSSATVVLAALHRYESLAQLRSRVRSLAAWARAFVDLEGVLFGKKSKSKLPSSKSVWTDKFVIELWKPPIGDFRSFVLGDEFFRALQNVDVRRIRECVNCDRIFWAGRTDSRCDTKECRNQYNVRMSRQRRHDDPEGYKARRQANEEYYARNRGARLKAKRKR